MNAPEQFTMEKLARPAGAAPALGGKHPNAGFLREQPDLRTVGFNVATGNVSQAHERVLFGQWEEPEGLADDEDMAVLRSLHGRAVAEWKAMAQTLQSVADDDDPSLNDAGRLKTAARVIEPKLDKLADVAAGQLGRVDASIAQEQAAVDEALKPKDAATSAERSDLRAYWKGKGSELNRLVMLDDGAGIDNETLLAVTSVPAYVTGITPDLHGRCRALLAKRLAPERVARIQALQVGKARALQALSSLDHVARRLVDFNKAKALAAKEKAHE